MGPVGLRVRRTTRRDTHTRTVMGGAPLAKHPGPGRSSSLGRSRNSDAPWGVLPRRGRPRPTRKEAPHMKPGPRMTLALLATLSLPGALLGPSGAAGQSVLERTPNLAGGWVGTAGTARPGQRPEISATGVVAGHCWGSWGLRSAERGDEVAQVLIPGGTAGGNGARGGAMHGGDHELPNHHTPSGADLVFDFSGVGHVNLGGLSLLLTARQLAQEDSRDLVGARPSGRHLAGALCARAPGLLPPLPPDDRAPGVVIAARRSRGSSLGSTAAARSGSRPRGRGGRSAARSARSSPRRSCRARPRARGSPRASR